MNKLTESEVALVRQALEEWPEGEDLGIWMNPSYRIPGKPYEVIDVTDLGYGVIPIEDMERFGWPAARIAAVRCKREGLNLSVYELYDDLNRVAEWFNLQRGGYTNSKREQLLAIMDERGV